MFSLISKPYFWVSAHQRVDFEFDYDSRVITFAGAITTGVYIGKLGVTYNTFFTEPVNVGDLIYIDSGEYKGYHVVKNFVLGIIVTETDATTINQTTGNVKLVKLHIFHIYKGYTAGAMAAVHPYTKIAEFKPEPSPDGFLKFNICGYINKIFDVLNSNDTTVVNNATIYPNLFNRIALIDIGTDANNPNLTLISEHRAANSALTSLELNRDYVNTGKHLNSGNLANYYFSCGITENILIQDDIIIKDLKTYVVTPPVVPTINSYDPTPFSNAWNKQN